LAIAAIFGILLNLVLNTWKGKTGGGIKTELLSKIGIYESSYGAIEFLSPCPLPADIRRADNNIKKVLEKSVTKQGCQSLML